MLVLFLNLFFLISCSNRKLKEISTTVLDVKVRDFYDGNIVGKKGTIILTTDWISEDFSFTKKNTCFSTTISNSDQSLPVQCGLWREKESDLFIFCNIDETIPKGDWTLKLNGIEFDYSDYSFNLIAETDYIFTKSDVNIIDLYSDKQIINLSDGKKSYDLKFKIISYNQENLILNWKTVLDNCKQENDELICTLTKKQVEENLVQFEGNTFLEVEYSNSNYRIKKFPFIPKIDIIHNIQKKDINVLITKLIQNVGEHDTPIAYETNINDLENVYMDLESFDLTFESEKEEKKAGCGFRKYDNNPLLLVCFINRVGEYWLKEITEDIKIESDLKYNFIIKPVKLSDKLYLNSGLSGSFIFFFYPEVIDFSKKDTFTVDYYIEEPKSLTGITFNENEKDLVCENLGSFMKRCTVPKSHFTGKKTGYYFTKHQNHLNKKSSSYEALPIKVIFPSDSKSKGNIISFSHFISFLLFLTLL